MKIGIVSPYFDSLGGGERYMFAIAARASCNHEVNIFWDDISILKKASERFKMSLNAVTVVPNVFAHGSFLEKAKATKAYDVLFFLTDGSIPLSFAKHNILHIQVPFTSVDMSWWKKRQFDAVIYNSHFTKDHVDASLRSLPSYIIYPPVSGIPVSEASRTNQILSVGRFGGLYNAKKFDVLVDAFESLIQMKSCKNYSLVLAGGVLSSDQSSFESLKKRVKKLPIIFYPNCSYTTLVSLYEQSKVYWHAAGFGESNPERMEHFGITPVEAMSAGTVPIVYNGGGLPEIVTDGYDGYVWKTSKELLSKTITLIEDTSLYKKMQDCAITSALRFSEDSFNTQLDILIGTMK